MCTFTLTATWSCSEPATCRNLTMAQSSRRATPSLLQAPVRAFCSRPARHTTTHSFRRNKAKTAPFSPVDERCISLVGRLPVHQCRTLTIAAISIVLDNPVKGPVYLNLIVNGRRFLKLSLVYEINSETPLRWKLDPY